MVHVPPPVLDLDVPLHRLPGTPAPKLKITCKAKAAALQCTKRPLVLVNVYEEGDRVRLIGAADHRYIGRTVAIWFQAAHAVVGHALVSQTGTFTTTVGRPPPGLRTTNLARYEAQIDGKRSLLLKLRRRMVVRSVESTSSVVRITGHVVAPLASPAAGLVLQRRVTCGGRYVTVKRFSANANGRFSIAIKPPSGAGGVATYRVQTMVRKHRWAPKLYPTYTLPVPIALR
jgi:hypothetical protein